MSTILRIAVLAWVFLASAASASIRVYTIETGGSFRTVQADKCRVYIEFIDEHIAGGVHGTIKGEFPIPVCTPNRHHYAYVTKDGGASGTEAIEWRLDTAGPPSASHWRLVTTARVGPGSYIFRRYRQFSNLIVFKQNVEVFLNEPGTGSTTTWIKHWVWPVVDFDQNGANSEYGYFGLLPDDPLLGTGPWTTKPNVVPLTASVLMRGEVSRSGAGYGLVQLNYAPNIGSPANQETQWEVKGIGGPPGEMHAGIVEVLAEPMKGYIYVAVLNTFIFNSSVKGFRLLTYSSHGSH